MTSKEFENILADLEAKAHDSVQPKLTEIKKKYTKLIKIANSEFSNAAEMRQAGRLYSELSGAVEMLLVLDNISYYDYAQIMADLGAILAATI